jgi:CBS domain-containing protein
MTRSGFRKVVGDVMTTPAVTAGPGTPYKELARLLAEHRIGALPIVDPDGVLVGIVSESDLLSKSTRRGPAPWWRPAARRSQRRAVATTAAASMSSPVFTATVDTPLPAAARLMEDAGVKHLPVVDTVRRVTGMVSRGDLLRPFLRSDEEIRQEIVDTVLPRWLWIDPATVTVTVTGGEVSLAGEVERRSDVDVITRIAGALDGVVAVDSRLTYRHDDVHERRRPTEARVS